MKRHELQDQDKLHPRRGQVQAYHFLLLFQHLEMARQEEPSYPSGRRAERGRDYRGQRGFQEAPILLHRQDDG